MEQNKVGRSHQNREEGRVGTNAKKKVSGAGPEHEKKGARSLADHRTRGQEGCSPKKDLLEGLARGRQRLGKGEGKGKTRQHRSAQAALARLLTPWKVVDSLVKVGPASWHEEHVRKWPS
jgi:hypothetical protein